MSLEILGIQLIGICFALFMIYITFIRKKRNEFTIKEASVWLILWIGFMVIAIFPRSMNFIIIDVIQMSRPLDFYIVAGLMFMTGILFYTYSLVRKTQKKIDDIVTKMAIDKKEKEK